MGLPSHLTQSIPLNNLWDGPCSSPPKAATNDVVGSQVAARRLQEATGFGIVVAMVAILDGLGAPPQSALAFSAGAHLPLTFLLPG